GAARRLDALDGLADRVGGLSRELVGLPRERGREAIGGALTLAFRGPRRFSLLFDRGGGDALALRETTLTRGQRLDLALQPPRQRLDLRFLVAHARARVGDHLGRQAQPFGDLERQAAAGFSQPQLVGRLERLRV